MGLLERFLTDLDVQVHILSNELVICGLRIAVLVIVIHILQDILRAGRAFGRDMIVVIHQIPVAVYIIIDQRFQIIDTILPVFDLQLNILAVFRQPAHQKVNIACLRIGQNRSVQARDLIIV